MPVTKTEKQRLALRRLGKMKPETILVAIDEVKKRADEALKGTLEVTERKALETLQHDIAKIEQQYETRLNKTFEQLDSALQKKVDAIPRVKGDKGDKPTQQELLALIEPLIPFVKDGKDGRTPSREEIQEVVTPLVQAEVENNKPDVLDKEELRKEIADEITGKIQKEIGDKISQIKRFSGGGATGAQPELISNISSDGTGDRKLDGTIDGSNTDFTLPRSPKTGGTRVFLNGVRMREGANNDYTVSGRTITFNTAPYSGSVILVDIEAGY